MPFTQEDLARLRARVAAIDPRLVAAADEVDLTLLTWFLTLSPLERLAAASRATKALHRFRVERPSKEG